MTGNTFLKYLSPIFFVPFIFKELLTLIVGSVVTCFYLVIIILSTPVYLYRFLLSKFTEHFKTNLGKMVTARGQFIALEDFTSSEHSPRANIVASVAIEGDVTVDQIRFKIKRNLLDKKDDKGELQYPEATQYVTSYMGFKYWKPDPFFDLNNHVKLQQSPSRPKSGTVSSSFSRDDLRDLLELLLNQSFHPGRSPWEVLLVNDYINPELSSEKMTLIILKAHHCLADGYGFIYTIMSAFSEQKPVLPRPRYVERRNLRLLLFHLTFPIRALRELSQFVMMSLQDNPWRIRDKDKAWKQLYQNSPIIPVKQVKEIKNRFGVSFSSVIHSCLGAAIGKCLESQYGVEEARRFEKMPCCVPLPMPGHPLTLRNYCTAVVIYLPTSRMDPVGRLRQCEDDIFRAKKSTMPIIGKFIPKFVGSLFEGMAALLGTNRSFPIGLSNMPSGDVPFEMDGKKGLTGQAVVGTAAGVTGLGILVYSYIDGIQLSLTGEKGIFSREDLNLIIHAFLEELDLLFNLSAV